MTLLRRLVDGLLEASVVGSFSSIGYSVRRRLFAWNDPAEVDMSGRVVLVTGANSGLGYAIAEQLARTGATLRVLVRDVDKGERTRQRLVAASGNEDIAYGVADLTDFDSIDAFADRFLTEHDRLDVLIHNAGAMFGHRRETAAGIERTLALHVVGPFRLTMQLLPALETPERSRVVWMSSGGMYTERLDVDRLESPGDYRPAVAYARAKRAQVVLAEEWARRAPAQGVSMHAMHPGWADTPGVERSLPGFHRIMKPLLRTPAEGADTAVWLATAPAIAGGSGSFWHDRRPRSPYKLPRTRHDRREATRLWDHVNRLAAAGSPPSLAGSPTA